MPNHGGGHLGRGFPTSHLGASSMVTYLDAGTAPLRNTGQIRLYGPEAFEGMRKACAIT